MKFWHRSKQPRVQPQWMIVGLGNPGAEYRETRHNVGFETVDRLAEAHKIRMERGRNRALVGLGTIGEVPVVIVKPMTYMNLSGQSVGPLARSYNLRPERIFVVADDLDLPVGKLRIKQHGSAGGHNGHKSIIYGLGSQDYPRLKIGIGSVDRRHTIDHVLSPFDREERETMVFAIRASVETCAALVQTGMDAALREVEEYNRERS